MFKSALAFMLMFLNFQPQMVMQADIADELAVKFRQGNSKEIAKSFATSIELIIIDQEDVYNKAQAEQILKDFFLKNPPNKTSIIHKLTNKPPRSRLIMCSHCRESVITRMSISPCVSLFL